ncbi:transposable element Tcb2 transposase [Trichonephila clavipes]|uniref:Transposable element Tcb2 transposase n=1 Tax=Trichonephila clavipes TaxID=2585209 RepID=A0A8X6RVG7_TRICX|nr:transposable element Tcb2 transposase [Trichonephila clavipes]
MRGRIIGKIEEGRKITHVAREFDIAHSVVSRLWKSFKTTGMCSRRHGGGRVRSTTPAEDRYIVLSAKRKVVPQKHRTARLQWCREHHNRTEQDWACVLFSDESRLSLSSDCRRQLIWRESGTAYRPENIQEKDRYPTCSIMVWAGIMINGRTRLHVVANGTMTGQRYIDEVLLPHVRFFRGAVGDKFVFMDDNATCHRTLTVQDCLDSEDIQRLVWPARSPDLNPIENVWETLGRQVSGRNYPPTNKNTLIRILTEEWDKLPQQLLDNVVQRRVLKEAWLACAPSLFDDFDNKDKIIQRIKDVPLSRNTMKDRILKLAENVTDQQKNDINSAPFISLCLDESIDTTKSASLAVFARYCVGNIIKEELIAITSLLTTTKGTDICTAVRNSLAEKEIDLKKLFSNH